MDSTNISKLNTTYETSKKIMGPGRLISERTKILNPQTGKFYKRKTLDYQGPFPAKQKQLSQNKFLGNIQLYQQTVVSPTKMDNNLLSIQRLEDAVLSDRKAATNSSFLELQFKNKFEANSDFSGKEPESLSNNNNSSSNSLEEKKSEFSQDSKKKTGFFNFNLNQVKDASMTIVSKLQEYVKQTTNSTFIKSRGSSEAPKINIIPSDSEDKLAPPKILFDQSKSNKPQSDIDSDNQGLNKGNPTASDFKLFNVRQKVNSLKKQNNILINLENQREEKKFNATLNIERIQNQIKFPLQQKNNYQLAKTANKEREVVTALKIIDDPIFKTINSNTMNLTRQKAQIGRQKSSDKVRHDLPSQETIQYMQILELQKQKISYEENSLLLGDPTYYITDSKEPSNFKKAKGELTQQNKVLYQNLKGEDSVKAKLNFNPELLNKEFKEQQIDNYQNRKSIKNKENKKGGTTKNGTSNLFQGGFEDFTGHAMRSITILTGPQYLQDYPYLLTTFERKEIQRYQQIYFAGTSKAKECRNMQTIIAGKNNNGFDNQGGFYKVVQGDHLDYRFEVLEEIDKGAFGQVVKCYDHKELREVAVKMNRNTSFDHNNSRVEIGILKKIREGAHDEEEYSPMHYYKSKIVKISESFLFRNHYCMVFELLGKNLYFDLKDNQFLGFDISSKIKPLVFQIIEGLIYLKHVSVIHCDLKPENILYSNYEKNEVKIIDFGSSCSSCEQGFSYVQSRFYRAPEVVLGLPYDHQIDMWSLGCIVAELYMGGPIFPGIDENELLEFHALICGIPSQAMIDKAKKKDKFFSDKGYKIKRSEKSRLAHLSKNSVNFNQLIFRKKKFDEKMRNSEIVKSLSLEERQMADFIKKCLQVDPALRMNCEEALRHDWFKDMLKEKEAQLERSKKFDIKRTIIMQEISQTNLRLNEISDGHSSYQEQPFDQADGITPKMHQLEYGDIKTTSLLQQESYIKNCSNSCNNVMTLLFGKSTQNKKQQKEDITIEHLDRNNNMINENQNRDLHLKVLNTNTTLRVPSNATTQAGNSSGVPSASKY